MPRNFLASVEIFSADETENYHATSTPKSPQIVVWKVACSGVTPGVPGVFCAPADIAFLLINRGKCPDWI